MEDETCEIVVDGAPCGKPAVIACARCDRNLCSTHEDAIERKHGFVTTVCSECKAKPGKWEVTI